MTFVGELHRFVFSLLELTMTGALMAAAERL